MWRPKKWRYGTHAETPELAAYYEFGADDMLVAILKAMPSKEVFKQQIHRVCYNDLDMKDFVDWVYNSFRGQFEEQKQDENKEPK